MSDTVGVIGIGQMGLPIATHLLDAGFDVIGTDVDSVRQAALVERGGRAAASPVEIAESAARIITSLPTEAALDAVVEAIVQSGRRPVTIIETSTMPLEVKERNRALAADAGIVLLDCPLSGTSAQAATKDVVVLASGDPQALGDCVEVFEAFARAHHLLGAFGLGSKMKFVANLLVAVHNVATAEAMVLGMKAGLDPQQVYDVISSGAGTSRVFEVRGPMMVHGDYDAPGITGRVFQKDLRVIGDFARSLECPTPLFAQAREVHVAAVAQGHGEHDVAAVCAILEALAGGPRQRPTPAAG